MITFLVVGREVALKNIFFCYFIHWDNKCKRQAVQLLGCRLNYYISSHEIGYTTINMLRRFSSTPILVASIFIITETKIRHNCVRRSILDEDVLENIILMRTSSKTGFVQIISDKKSAHQKKTFLVSSRILHDTSYVTCVCPTRDEYFHNWHWVYKTLGTLS